jgi:hypothetical protein
MLIFLGVYCTSSADVVQNSGGSEIIGARENQERKP